MAQALTNAPIHFESVCYHPLFLFTEHGDCLAATLRPGNTPTTVSAVPEKLKSLISCSPSLPSIVGFY